MNNRDKKGRFARYGRISISILIIMAIMIISAMYAVIYQYNHPKIVTNTVTVDNSDKNFAQKIDSLEKSVVEAVHACEKINYTENDGLVTYDPTDVLHAKNMVLFNAGKKHFVNKGEFSFGTYQYKQTTVIYYYKTLYNKVITGKEAILIALDDEKAGQLTQDILFKTKDGWTNWKNCSNSLNLMDMINAIKKIK